MLYTYPARMLSRINPRSTHTGLVKVKQTIIHWESLPSTYTVPTGSPFLYFYGKTLLGTYREVPSRIFSNGKVFPVP
ncbi:MAG: hypothetical protein ACP5IE_08990, partial [Infirmifilum sp.]